MSVLETLAAREGLSPVDYLFRAGMILSESGTGAQLTPDDQREVGQVFMDAARLMRRDRATIRALEAEWVEERAIAAREEADVIVHPAMAGRAR